MTAEPRQKSRLKECTVKAKQIPPFGPERQNLCSKGRQRPEERMKLEGRGRERGNSRLRRVSGLEAIGCPQVPSKQSPPQFSSNRQAKGERQTLFLCTFDRVKIPFPLFAFGRRKSVYSVTSELQGGARVPLTVGARERREKGGNSGWRKAGELASFLSSEP